MSAYSIYSLSNILATYKKYSSMEFPIAKAFGGCPYQGKLRQVELHIHVRSL